MSSFEAEISYETVHTHIKYFDSFEDTFLKKKLNKENRFYFPLIIHVASFSHTPPYTFMSYESMQIAGFNIKETVSCSRQSSVGLWKWRASAWSDYDESQNVA